MGQGNFLRVTTSAAASGQITMAKFTPGSAGTSWSALTGTVTSGGVSYTSINGGFDLFVRPNTPPSSDQSWFRVLDLDARSGNNGLRIILTGGGGGFQFQVVSNSATAFGSSAGSWDGASKTLGVTSALVTGAVNHVAATFNTSASGQVTVKLFAVGSGAAIDTASSANLLGTLSFYANASVIGANVLGSGAWSMYGRQPTVWADSSIDYDCVRLYNADPKVFPALSFVPTAAPAITTPPQGQSVTAGQSATFSVVAAGTPAPGYQWQKNGTDIPGATSSSYTTPATAAADDGALFRVVVSNAAGSVTSSAATLTVANSYSAWKSRSFTSAQQADGAVSGPAANPAGDGLSNLLKYACGLDPGSNQSALAPRVDTRSVAGSDYLHITFRRQKNAPDLTCTVQVSNDLATWYSGPSFTTQVSQSDNGDGTLTLTVRDLSPSSSHPKRFLRLVVSLP